MRKTFTLFVLYTFTVEKSFCDTTEDYTGSGINQDSADDGDMDGVLESTPTQNVPELKLDDLKQLAQDTKDAIFIEGKRFFEHKDIVTAIVAGGILGAVLATVLAALFILKWQNCSRKSYTAGQQTTSQDDDL
ncbi:syndecan 4-A-like [Corythoichthys intestinalis]|uniref:syndecan 4-A-like n=1 Tax=Corythoichthys intestinalis TaxID=161448 RepID=UPI0025A66E0A|nr:syndecan 4-A-like [Corythoichthys intestinalis]